MEDIVGRITRLRKDFTMPIQTTVPLLELKLQYDQIREEVEPVLREVCDSQYFVLGPKVVELENKIAAYVGTNEWRLENTSAWPCFVDA